jgi:hypothetical protein
MQSDPECKKLGFPDHLHSNSRPLVPQFEQEECVYRRYLPDQVLKDGMPPIAIFDSNKMSVSAARFCNSPLDALYDAISGQNLVSFGIVSLKVRHIEEKEYRHPDTNVIYKFRVRHDPTQCYYPHCEVDVLTDGQPTELKKKNPVKTIVKHFWANACTVIQLPGGGSPDSVG